MSILIANINMINTSAGADFFRHSLLDDLSAPSTSYNGADIMSIVIILIGILIVLIFCGIIGYPIIKHICSSRRHNARDPLIFINLDRNLEVVVDVNTRVDDEIILIESQPNQAQVFQDESRMTRDIRNNERLLQTTVVVSGSLVTLSKPLVIPPSEVTLLRESMS
jgi:hypothetical protein